MREKLLRDPVHDLIVFDSHQATDRLLLDLIDTPEMQRLRRIRQTGMAFFAFHGAEHSRFTHSVGVVHVVRRMLERLVPQAKPIDPLTFTAVQCAGLLHDVGHGPFSHVMERFFGRHHEEWTKQVILDESTNVHRLLVKFDKSLPAMVVAALEGTLKPGWLNFLISSQLDADRFDYLIRDSIMTGVKYGIFDLERLLLMLRVSEDEEKVCIAAKGLLPVEKYLQSRYHMYRQVYFHKTTTAAESMLMAMLNRARDLGDSIPGAFAQEVLRAEGQVSIESYLYFDDPIMLSWWKEWTRHSDPVLADLSARLLERRLFKSVEIANFDEQDIDASMRVQRAEEILQSAGLDPHYYLLYGKSSDVAYRPYNPRGVKSSDTIWIQGEEGICDVKDVSPTIRAFTESPYSIWRAFFPESHKGSDIRSRVKKEFNE